MSTQGFRTEKDSMGELQVPADALYAAQTQRAVDNFGISDLTMPRRFIEALGLIKAATAEANRDLGDLDAKIAGAIIEAAEAVASGAHDAHFPVDVFQTGSGTSSNMNANEVIANLASRSWGIRSIPMTTSIWRRAAMTSFPPPFMSQRPLPAPRNCSPRLIIWQALWKRGQQSCGISPPLVVRI